MIFQAIGGWYTSRDILRHLFSVGTKQDGELLREKLSERYGEEVILYHKGRAALAEAVRLATGGEGKVAVSGLTCYSLIQAVESAGCTPVYVDIREEDLHFSGRELEDVLQRNEDIKAVVVQNMLGIPADIDSITRVSKEHNITVIEDLAHSAGASYANGSEVGTVGDLVILSFGRDKALDVVNGGALVIRDSTLTGSHPINSVPLIDQARDRLYPLIAACTRLYYPLGRYVMAVAIRTRLVVRSADGVVDSTQRMPNWQAKLALKRLLELDNTVQHRRKAMSQYREALAVQVLPGVSAPGSAIIRLPLLVDNPLQVIKKLADNGVQANDVWYDAPVSPKRYFTKIAYPSDECPIAVDVSSRLINLPTHRRIGPRQIKKISSVINTGEIA